MIRHLMHHNRHLTNKLKGETIQRELIIPASIVISVSNRELRGPQLWMLQISGRF
jgi:hypothetical protein